VETGDIVLMRSDPRDVLGAIRLSKATVRKMKQNLFWAAIYNIVAIPVAAGMLYPFGILLRPEFGALAMSASSITVVTNALLLRRVDRVLTIER
jgi:cation transport ATPase